MLRMLFWTACPGAVGQCTSSDNRECCSNLLCCWHDCLGMHAHASSTQYNCHVQGVCVQRKVCFCISFCTAAHCLIVKQPQPNWSPLNNCPIQWVHMQIV